MFKTIIVEVLGYTALLFSLLSFQQKKRSSLMKCQFMASFLFSVQLFMKGGIAGAILDMIATVRTLTFAKVKNPKIASSKYTLFFFLIILTVAGCCTYFVDKFFYIATLGACLSTVALWMKEPSKTRIISLFVGPCWIVYNIFYKSAPGVINEIIAITSIVIGIIRLDIKRNK